MIARVSEEDLTNQFFQEIRKGLEVQDSFSQLREAASAKLAHAARGAKNEMAGKILGFVPQQEYFELMQKYGDCWDDRAFVRDFFKTQPHLKSANV